MCKMNVRMNKYNEKIAAFVLVCFLAISGFSIFHNHHIELNRPAELSQQANETSNNYDGSYAGVNFVCTVHTNYILLQTVDLFDLTVFTINQYFNSEQIKTRSKKQSLSYFYLSDNHRAPPISS